MKKNLYKYLVEVPLSEFAERAGGEVAMWSRRINSSKDFKISSLFAPAQRLEITPGELLDLILERRLRHVQEKIQQVDLDLARALPKQLSDSTKGWGDPNL